MATVCVVKNSRFWQAFWLQDGRQKQKSTKIPVGKTKAEQRKSRELAKSTADKMEATAKGQTTLSRACDALRAVAAAYGDEESIPTIRELLNSIPASSKPSSELNLQPQRVVRAAYGFQLAVRQKKAGEAHHEREVALVRL